MYEGKKDYVSGRLKQALNAIYGGRFGNLADMHPMLNALEDGNDRYCVCWDFESYANAQTRVDDCYSRPKEWAMKSILSTARSAKFSTDRTIREYAANVWYLVSLMC